MDILSDVLLSLRLLATRLGIMEFASPWGIDIPAPPERTIIGAVLIEGTCWFCAGESKPEQLNPGDAVLVTHKTGHRMWAPRDLPRSRITPFSQIDGLSVLQIDTDYRDAIDAPLRLGGEGAKGRMLVFDLIAQDAGPRAILGTLPPFMHVPATEPSLPVWATMADAYLGQGTRHQPGFSALSSKLVELIFTNILRSYLLGKGGDDPGWMRGIRNARIGRSLSAIHKRPYEAWTVSMLAQEARMARSTYARLFNELMGIPPIEYLINQRMQLAYGMIVVDRKSVAAVAETLGYRSERAFRQAFKLRYGCAPSQARRRQPTDLAQ
ncbi:AraC family transcriptional regulator [Croceicoccus bisphenolivorans]|uniref:AraC family transcriptional regulator n=1 Tax=Croceicoccus bisphenolivorans TaxID=1783232 RepID=UPI00082A47C9|nr:AraC family transcriptional regulator [Croceicoccus bisphenolivorans]